MVRKSHGRELQVQRPQMTSPMVGSPCQPYFSTPAAYVLVYRFCACGTVPRRRIVWRWCWVAAEGGFFVFFWVTVTESLILQRRQ
ncbi:hypothetical protein RHMOL_Rhmol01G0311600 [Rhododendron molle]|uniref:Uncharacterized protein n=1 Tax=Rhododendron molle TaxID=49168 RepID=A0ACC0Q801_RHOML|nr:hypothetical protein RHMOL_Rhmol01G0311600 [Rhododendron molle]